MTFHGILNGAPLYIAVILGIAFIIVIAFIFYRKS